MSYLSIKAKVYGLYKYSLCKQKGHKCKNIRENYTNFAGTTVPPLTKQQYEKAMKRYRKMK